MIRAVRGAKWRWQFLFALFFLYPLLFRTAKADDQKAPSQRDFEAQDVSALDALVRLGQVYELPMAIISLDTRIANTRVVVRVVGATVKVAMSEVMKNLPDYEWRQRNGLIVVEPRAIPTITKQLLDTAIPDISVEQADVDGINFLLWMELQLQVDPARKAKGFLGSGHLRNYRRLGRLDLKNATIERALDEIVLRIGKAAWIVFPPPPTLKNTPRDRLWSVVSYADPPAPLDQLCCIDLSPFSEI
jgi:hypothetical protein